MFTIVLSHRKKNTKKIIYNYDYNYKTMTTATTNAYMYSGYMNAFLNVKSIFTNLQFSLFQMVKWSNDHTPTLFKFYFMNTITLENLKKRRKVIKEKKEKKKQYPQ